MQKTGLRTTAQSVPKPLVGTEMVHKCDDRRVASAQIAKPRYGRRVVEFVDDEDVEGRAYDAFTCTVDASRRLPATEAALCAIRQPRLLRDDRHRMAASSERLDQVAIVYVPSRRFGEIAE